MSFGIVTRGISLIHFTLGTGKYSVETYVGAIIKDDLYVLHFAKKDEIIIR
jgi:hypothetical protein